MVEIIPKPASQYPLWLNIVFYISLAAFLGSLATLFLFKQFQAQTEEISRRLDAVLSQARSSDSLKAEQEILRRKKKIEDFGSIARERKNPASLFSFLEESSHPEVFFRTISFAMKENKTTLGGEAESFRALEQQLLVLKTKKEVASFTLGNVAPGEGGKVGFQLELVFQEDFLP